MINCVNAGFIPSLCTSYEEWKKKYKVDDADDSDGEKGGGRGPKFGGFKTRLNHKHISDNERNCYIFYFVNSCIVYHVLYLI